MVGGGCVLRAGLGVAWMWHDKGWVWHEQRLWVCEYIIFFPLKVVFPGFGAAVLDEDFKGNSSLTFGPCSSCNPEEITLDGMLDTFLEGGEALFISVDESDQEFIDSGLTGIGILPSPQGIIIGDSNGKSANNFRWVGVHYTNSTLRNFFSLVSQVAIINPPLRMRREG